MKYLVLLLLALVVVWRFRSKSDQPHAQPLQDRADAAPKAEEMQACTHCGLHMPSTEMLSGARGRYCSAEHRTLAEH